MRVFVEVYFFDSTLLSLITLKRFIDARVPIMPLKTAVSVRAMHGYLNFLRRL